MSPDAVAGPVGQDARFAEYVVPELEVLYRVAQSITRNPTDAQDLVQDTLLRAYRAIERFDGRYPRAWLLTIMRNAQVNRVRRKRPELMHDPDETMSRVADESPDGADAESQLMDQEFEAPIEAALAALPEKFLRVVELVDLNQLSYQEAADALGIPVGTVMSRLHRARRNIRQHLEASDTEET
jgi:RNA polymerase sigma-70 factor (ECF subfamily)